ncbi:MAG: hypothetical protein N2C12_15990 [Planctomycetales bacterium]
MASEHSTPGEQEDNRLDIVHQAEVDAAESNAPKLDETVSAVLNLSQMRNQATQLASHLYNVHENLDRREAKLNSRTATSDSDERATRLRLAEWQQELAQQEERLQQRERNVSDTESKLAAEAVTKTNYEKLVDKLNQRQKYLDSTEAMLLNGQADLEAQQQKIESQQQQDEAANRQLRIDIVEQQQEQKSKWQQRQQSLSRRNRELNLRREAIEQTRSEVCETHLENLQLRLAIEELWTKLSNADSIPELDSELKQIRKQLAGHYSAEINAVAGDRQQLHAAQARLTEQREVLADEGKGLHSWVARQQQEMEQQAARLVAQEQKLDRRHADLIQRSSRWDRERRYLQDEIRRLMTELRNANLETAELSDPVLAS